MARQSLDTLPVELLRKICRELPCYTALDFILVCRSINIACEDWTIWRAFVTQDLPHATNLLDIPNDAWKAYAVAAVKTIGLGTRPDTYDFGTWLPQMAALCHPSIQQADVTSLDRLWSATLGFVTTHLSEYGLFRFSNSAKSREPMEWCLAQATAFTLSIRYASLPSPTTHPPRELLLATPWLPITGVLPESIGLGAEKVQYAIIQHALANQVVGFFAASLRSTRAAKPPINIGLIPDPPLAISIPFTTLMELPRPLSKDSLERFSTCHLRTMASPTFLTQGEWTGAIGTLTNDEWAEAFNCVGGPHHDGYTGSIHDEMHELPGNFPHGRDFEGVVRFSIRPGSDNGDDFEVHSNNFHTENSLHRLRMVVRRSTGHIRIHHWHAIPAAASTTDGVITPFGIVACIINPGVWLWLWKTEWTELAA